MVEKHIRESPQPELLRGQGEPGEGGRPGHLLAHLCNGGHPQCGGDMLSVEVTAWSQPQLAARDQWGVPPVWTQHTAADRDTGHYLLSRHNHSTFLVVVSCDHTFWSIDRETISPHTCLRGLARYRVHTTATWDQFWNIIKMVRNHSDGVSLVSPWLIEYRSYKKNQVWNITHRASHITHHILYRNL